MNRLMRILMMFDLPVKTKAERRSATQFRNFLVGDGYHMVQYSVYARVCNGRDSVETHKKRILLALPSAESLISKAAGHFTRAAYDRQAYLSQTAGTVSLPLSKVLTLGGGCLIPS